MTTSQSDSNKKMAALAQAARRLEQEEDNAPLRLPEWVRRSVLNTEENRETRLILKEQNLNTICESGRCPNKGECWAKGTATFMLMGALCTRTCRFCSVNKGTPSPLDPEEPQRIATAAQKMGLRHVVLTSVIAMTYPIRPQVISPPPSKLSKKASKAWQWKFSPRTFKADATP